MTVITDNVWSNRLYNQAGTREFAPCTAWVNFNGAASPITIRDSLNVSSITDNGTGDYAVNFATAMDNNNYSLASDDFTTGAAKVSYGYSTYTVNSCRIRTLQIDTVNLADPESVFATIFGGITL